ncbi:unnamed protein product [Tuber melanosporum]|uniref:(Perigord truffle) hypothetical protein n=1 Tax=Tuber melanosporum (strain Mel28) TaxID=656061 RepID=D5GDQ3_TUBMM|nr:uncharacterized protein GSTUM_00006224001 [Tuber melanosporum]CAZ82646.1 unnamed protein product [Tuber melanosporum]
MLASRRSAKRSVNKLSPVGTAISSFLFLAFPEPGVRSYATVNSTNNSKYDWPPNASPTPYQIFNCKQGAPYSKARFYELVKLYHPDHFRHRPGEGPDISEPIRLERFRLIVAANAILSDPVKRANYDYSGAGWNLTSVWETTSTNASQRRWWTEREGHGSFARQHYGKGGPNDPAQNATWEDWERWRQRRAHPGTGGGGEHQGPLYTSNGTFVTVVFILASGGALMNISRANANGHNFLEQREIRHAEISREWARRKREVAVLGSKEERVQTFLKNRDPVRYGIVGPGGGG